MFSKIYKNFIETKTKTKINKQFIAASKNNQIAALESLLNQGADVHANNDYALKSAAFFGYLEVVKLLVTHGANIHADGEMALRRASFHGHLPIVEFLIAHGADIHADDNEALKKAACYGRLEVVKFLVKRGANIHANNDAALKLAELNGHHDVWQALLFFSQEEKLLVAALGVMPVLAASESMLVPQKQHPGLKKFRSSKI